MADVKLIDLEGLAIFKKKIEAEIDNSQGSGGSSTGDNLTDVNIEIEGKDWKALGWYDLIKVTKVTSEENPYDPDDPKYPNWQPTITPQNPKFILDFTDMWTAIYEDCANGNNQSGSTTKEICMYEYDVHIDIDNGTYNYVIDFRLLESNNEKAGDRTLLCYVNGVKSTYDGEIDSTSALSLEELLAGVPTPISATGVFADDYYDAPKTITGIWMQNNIVCIQYIGDKTMVGDEISVTDDMTNKSYVRLKSISMLTSDVK